MTAYACKIHRENFDIIASEKPDFDREFTERWLDEHEQGYFIRDPSSPFDCQFMQIDVFNELYVFDEGTPGEVFRVIYKK